MSKLVLVNGVSFKVEDFKKEKIQGIEKERLKTSFRFYVKSEEYHDVTVLLYKNDFQVEVPDENLSFDATIFNYSTSLDNLYEKDNVGEFRLELIEKG